MNDTELMQATFPEPRWAVQGLIPEGVTVLAAKAKSGKSWLALGIALSVVDGSPALGRFTVTRGEVLYLALEDSFARMQSRLRRLLQGRDEPPTGLLHIETEWLTAEEGGIQEIENWLSDFPSARLVVIDVLRRFDPMVNSYNQDSKKIQKLGDLGLRRHVGIIVVQHMYKGPGVSASSPDWMDKIQGSTGVVGAAQCILGLSRDRGSDEGLLRVVGKDVAELNVPMVFSAAAGTWMATEPGGEMAAALSDERKAIYRALEATPGLTAVEIGKALGQSYNTVRHLAWAMVAAEQLVKLDGRYYTPAQIEAMKRAEPDPQTSFVEHQLTELVPPPVPAITPVTPNGHGRPRLTVWRS